MAHLAPTARAQASGLPPLVIGRFERNRLQSGNTMALEAGTRLGTYEILSHLGAGGMGEVYRARDTKLGREVAIKVLPDEMAADPSRLARFEREAKVLATLDHTNIVHIYSVEDAEGIHFLTLQLVRGRSLKELIPETGMSVEQFFEIATPLVEGLRAAHSKGITHRDLKPENVMIGSEGHVKILDFGLAKLRGPHPTPDSGHSPTATMTQEGVVLGTIPYMSPEQVRGEVVDERTDIFSIGVMLYEMAAGRRPFVGDNKQALAWSIIQDSPPPLAQIRPDLPPGLDRVVAHCLEKERGRRFQSAEELCSALRDPSGFANDSAAQHLDGAPQALPARVPEARSSTDTIGAAPTAVLGPAGDGSSPTVSRLWWWLGLSALAAALVTAGSYVLRRPSGTPAPALEELHTRYEQFTSQPGTEQYPRISPDGKWVIYSGEGSDNSDIYLQRVGGQTVINLTEDSPAEDKQPALSGDGERIAFRSDRQGGGIFVMGPTGEAVRRVTRHGFNPTWSPDLGEIAFATESVDLNPLNWAGVSSLWVVSSESGEERRLLDEGDGVQPTWSPGGQRIAFTARWGDPVQMDIRTVPAAGGSSSALTDDEATDWSPAWSPDGRYVYFASDRSGSMNLWRIAVDEATGTALGEPEAITTPATFLSHISLAADGRTLTYSSVLMTQNVQKVALDLETATAQGLPSWVTSGSRLWSSPDVSPDGEWLVFYSRVNPEGSLYVARTNGTGLRQLTDDLAIDRVPRWSPDGQWILYFSDRSGRLQLWKIRPDGSDQTQLTDLSGASLATWSPDGSRIAVFTPEPPARVHIFRPDRPWEDQSPDTLPEPPEAIDPFVAMSWSPDGATLAGQSGYPGLGIVTYSLERHSYERVTDFGEWPVFLPDGRRIMFVSEGRGYFVVDSRTKELHKSFSVERDVIGPPRLSADGREVYFTRRVTEADLWLLSLSEI